jgi:uracil-DNA glycosylase
MTDAARLGPGWRAALAAELDAPYMAALGAWLAADTRPAFPPADERLRALELTPPERVRVVILGQDPYHGAGQAHGLSFSVRPGVRVPPSLANIYRELERDLGLPHPGHGHLEHWARQGVLLLNAVLSVAEGAAGSHARRGWERFTDAVVRAVADDPAPKVFMLWGAHAQAKAAFVGAPHLVLTAPHPSPLSAHRGFIGCGHFSAANAFLETRGRGAIDWRLPPEPNGGARV